MREVPCPDVRGRPAQARVAGRAARRPQHLRRSARCPSPDCAKFLREVDLTDRERQIAERVIKEIQARLGFLLDVGLDYLSLDRPAGTLSGGEAQRIRLATQIGSGLVGVLYVLDEPSIGLHQRDNHRLIETLTRLRDLGNTLIVVEHDEDTIATADWVVDIGPGAGEHGGQVVALRHGRRRCSTHPDSLTGEYLSGARRSRRPSVRRPQDAAARSRSYGAREHNLQEHRRRLPARRLRRGHRRVRVGQVDAGQRHPLHRRWPTSSTAPRQVPGRHKTVNGLEHLDKVVARRPGPIGRTPALATRRPTPASSTTSASCSPRRPRPRSAATCRAGSPSTSRAAAARRARATARSRSR